MCVVSHGYGGLGRVRDGGGGWQACETKPRRLIACREMSERFLSTWRYTDGTRLHRCPGVQLWLRSSRNWSVFLERP